MKQKIRPNFWKIFALNELNKTEWEALCDGCGKCCLIKLENEETNEVHYTNIACRLFEKETCKCKNYQNRKKIVNSCLILTMDTLKEIYQWMPTTCAYRLIYEGKELQPWHHLISNSKETIHTAEKSVKNLVFSECEVSEDNWHDHITSNC